MPRAKIGTVAGAHCPVLYMWPLPTDDGTHTFSAAVIQFLSLAISKITILCYYNDF